MRQRSEPGTTEIGRRAWLAGAAASVALPRGSHAQVTGFPDRAVRIVVPFGPGGPTDIIARTMAERLTEIWQKPVVVENRPGGGGSVGTEYVARAAPDGYTLLLMSSAHVTNYPLIQRPTYHPVRDFAPILQMAYNPLLFVVHPSVPASSLAEFVTFAKAQRDGVNIATPGVGTNAHLATALLAMRGGFATTYLPYASAGAALAGLLAGDGQASILPPLVVSQHISSGRLRALAVTSGRRWREFPSVPSVVEIGWPELEVVSWFGLGAPAGVSPGLLEKLQSDITAALRSPAVGARIFAGGYELIDAGPAAFRAVMEAELEKWTHVVRTVGIRLE